jgi:hypothetical protein
MSLFCSGRNRDEERPPTPVNQDRLAPDQIDRLHMIQRFGSVEQAKRVTFLCLCAMRGDFDDDR